MNSNDKFKMHGAMTATLVRPDNSVTVFHKDNMIVTTGFDFIADAIGKSVSRPSVMSHIGVGKGTTAVAAGQSALVDELLPRQTAAYAYVAGSKSFTFSVTLGPGVATGAITEAAVFNAATAGTMLDRVVFDVINKGADDTLIVNFTFTLS